MNPHAVATVVERLVAAGCVAADDEAAQLVASAPDEGTLEASIRRREQGEPLAWIVGAVTFCGRSYRVDEGVYVPRYQSEDLARRAAALLPAHGAAADLCTGAGVIAAHLQAEVPSAMVIGLDIDRRAARCAYGNGANVVVGDLDGPLRPGSFDVVTAVAPYVPTGQLRLLPADVQRYEPRRALHGGGDGLDLLRRIVAGSARLLRPGGWLLVEVGGDQAEALRPVLAAHGYDAATPWFDDDGELRGLAAEQARALPRGRTGGRS